MAVYLGSNAVNMLGGQSSGGGSPTLQTKSKTYTPTTSQQSETVTADSGYDGLDAVNITVNAMPSGGVDIPIFTSDDFETFTCNKTWAECFDIVDSGRTAACLTDSYTMMIGLIANTYDATQICYTSLGQYTGEPEYDIIYHSNGTIEIVTPSHSAPVLTTKTITANGTYNASSDSADGYSSVEVNVSGSGSSKNVQVVQGTTRTTSSTLTAIGAEMTVSKTGTYDVYWSAFRSNTSASYTYGTQLYVDGTAYGTQNTTWSNHVQNNHLTGVSLTAGQKIRVYGRNSRGSSYYIYAPTLVIVEA